MKINKNFSHPNYRSSYYMQNNDCNLPYCPKHGIISKRSDNDKNKRKNRLLNKSSPIIINADLVRAESQDALTNSAINDEMLINAFKQGKKVGTMRVQSRWMIPKSPEEPFNRPQELTVTKNLFSRPQEVTIGRSKSLPDIELEMSDTNDSGTDCIMELHRKKYASMISPKQNIKRLLSN